MKTANLTGPALDWAVAKCEGRGIEFDDPRDPWLTRDGISDQPLHSYTPSTDWSQGGPIIEREGMLIEFHGDHWSATMWWDDGDSANEVKQKGPTPLIAAMRCYVAAKLSDEVDLPDELAEAIA